MAEEPAPDALEGVLAHLAQLLELARRGPPQWVRHDLTFGQLRLLFFLARFGPISIGRLAELLDVTDATASEIVDRLQRRGLVSRSHAPDDRRRVECGLSEDGRKLLAEVSGARREVLRAALSTLDADELRRLDGLLATMLSRLPVADRPGSTQGGGGMSLLDWFHPSAGDRP